MPISDPLKINKNEINSNSLNTFGGKDGAGETTCHRSIHQIVLGAVTFDDTLASRINCGDFAEVLGTAPALTEHVGKG